MSILKLEDSLVIQEYKDTMKQCISLYYPNMKEADLDTILDYSINKRYKEEPVQIENSYKKTITNTNILNISEYIRRRHPITTAFGTMFENHGDVPNPMANVVQDFLDNRSIHKKEMFKYPKNSEMYEHFNLMQQLDKIDTNGIYGVIGLYISLLYNNNVATSITSQGRALTSSATMLFEGFLGNNNKFGSLNEIIEFVNHIKSEKNNRIFNDFDWLDDFFSVTLEDVFAKLVINCEWLWIPNDNELDIIWRICQNLNQEELNRVYYKNNLYAFLDNKKVFTLIEKILTNLEEPMTWITRIPENVQDDMILLKDLMKEYVYYGYMFIDRIDKTQHMIRSIVMVSDTDSTIISLDAWYRYVSEHIKGKSFKIMNTQKDAVADNPESLKDKKVKVYDYNFDTDEIIETYRIEHPRDTSGEENMRNSIIVMMNYILDALINDYMVKFCKNVNSIYHDDKNSREEKNCKIIMKSEFDFRRLMMTQVKKNYASLITMQEGNPVDYNAQVTVAGIECLTKSSKAKSTRDALKKILEDDILRADSIDQLKFLKDISILEKRILQSIRDGSKEYYKPATIKSASAYDNPLRIQGIKASIAWNAIKEKELPAIDLSERNAIDIAKVIINKTSVEKIKDKYPEIYNNIQEALQMEEFCKKAKDKNGNDKIISQEITAIAIPTDVLVPEWLLEFIDYNTLVSDNIGGFPYSSIGIVAGPSNSNTNYTNIIEL